MPLDNDNFQWRPNDNGARTNLRYSLEAEKWVNAVSSAQRNNQTASFGKDLAVIGMLIQLVFSVTLLIVIGILMLIKSIIYFVESKTSKDNSGTDTYSTTFNSGDDRSLIGYIFYNRDEELRDIWKFIYYTIFIFIIEIAVLYILSQIWPEHVRFYRDTVIFAAAVSVFYAFTGMGD